MALPDETDSVQTLDGPGIFEGTVVDNVDGIGAPSRGISDGEFDVFGKELVWAVVVTDASVSDENCGVSMLSGLARLAARGALAP